MIKYDIVKRKLNLEFHEVQFTHRLMCIQTSCLTDTIINSKSMIFLNQWDIDNRLNSIRNIISQSIERKLK